MFLLPLGKAVYSESKEEQILYFQLPFINCHVVVAFRRMTRVNTMYCLEILGQILYMYIIVRALLDY